MSCGDIFLMDSLTTGITYHIIKTKSNLTSLSSSISSANYQTVTPHSRTTVPSPPTRDLYQFLLILMYKTGKVP